MKDWTDIFVKYTADKTAALDDSEIIARWSWVDTLCEKAGRILTPEYLRAMPPAEVYDSLRELSIAECPIRLTNLGRVNDAGSIVASLLKLLETPGGLEEKYRAAKFPQAGLVTITELLCVARPARFICRNTAFTRALARVTPFYGYAALNEMGYDEFLDICRVLADTLEQSPRPAITARVRRCRYLWLYALLTTA